MSQKKKHWSVYMAGSPDSMRARVWAAGVVEAIVLQSNPNFQDSDNASCGCLEGQMDGEFKEEQTVTLIVWIGALEGGFWGWWGCCHFCGSNRAAEAVWGLKAFGGRVLLKLAFSRCACRNAAIFAEATAQQKPFGGSRPLVVEFCPGLPLNCPARTRAVSEPCLLQVSYALCSRAQKWDSHRARNALAASIDFFKTKWHFGAVLRWLSQGVTFNHLTLPKSIVMKKVQVP
eukprot:1153045-Pelagomonas_calceolata.AAC.2